MNRLKDQENRDKKARGLTFCFWRNQWDWIQWG